MRCFLVALVLGLASLGAAQDTTFSTGPQYLMSFGSPMFARSIATPSLSWENTVPAATTTSVATEQSSSDLLESVSSALDAQRQTALMSIYYGRPAITEGAILSSPDESNHQAFPAVTIEVGVSSTTDAHALQAQSYGVTMGESAASGKAQRSRAHRVYTNEDLESLRPAN